MNYFINTVKVIVVLFIIWVGYLYYTRPEMEITPDTFVKVMDSRGYKIYRKYNNEADIFYTAISKDKNIVINYAGFNSEQKCQEFYEKTTKFDEEKHQFKMKRELYIGKPNPEMQSYSYYDDYYKAIYTKKAVIYSKNLKFVQGNIDSAFDALFVPVKFDMETVQKMLSDK